MRRQLHFYTAPESTSITASRTARSCWTEAKSVVEDKTFTNFKLKSSLKTRRNEGNKRHHFFFSFFWLARRVSVLKM